MTDDDDDDDDDGSVFYSIGLRHSYCYNYYYDASTGRCLGRVPQLTKTNMGIGVLLARSGGFLSSFCLLKGGTLIVSHRESSTFGITRYIPSGKLT